MARCAAHAVRFGLVAVAAGALFAAQPTPVSAWTQYRGSGERTGSASWPLERPPPVGRALSSTSLGTASMIDSSPVVANNGIVYLAARTERGNLHAIGPSGFVWSSFLEGFDVRATPALLPDGRLVVVGSNVRGTLDRTGEARTTSRERVFILSDTDGRITHRTDLYENAFMRSPLVDSAGTIYWSFGDLLYRLATRTSGSRLVAQRLVSATGNLTSEFELPIWLAAPPPGFPPEPLLQPSPASSSACEDIVGTGVRARSYRFWPGTLRGWVKQLTLQTTPALGASGHAYVGMYRSRTSEGSLAALSQTGAILWRTRISGRPAAPPAIGPAPARGVRSCKRQNGSTFTTTRRDRIYFTTYGGVTQGGRLYAFDDEGGIRWVRRLTGQPGPPVVVQLQTDELILVASGSRTGPNFLYAARSSGDLSWARPLAGQALGSPAIAGGLIYVATRTRLHRFR
jgi:outer membrane protein assembly factor BamB